MIDLKKVEMKSKERFGEGGLYCAESVLTTLAEELGIASPLIPRIASGFCSGISRTMGMCGAVSGGIMALGIVYGRDNAEGSQDEVYEKVRQFLSAFKNEFESTNCYDLIGVDLSTETADKNAIEKCRQFTGKAASLAAQIINDGEMD